MKLKVVIKAATPQDLRKPVVIVTNAETGETLKGVRAVSFEYDFRSVPILKLEILGFEAEIEGFGVDPAPAAPAAPYVLIHQSETTRP